MRVLAVAHLYLARVWNSRGMIIMSVLGVVLAGVLVYVPFLGIPFTPITETALRSQMAYLNITLPPDVSTNLLLGLVFMYTQAPALVVLFSGLAVISFVSYFVGGDRMTRAFELLLASPLRDREILYGVFIAALIYGLAVWLLATAVFVASSALALSYYLGQFPSPPRVYTFQLFVLAPLMIILTGMISVLITLIATRIIKSHTMMPLSVTNPFATLSLLPLLLYVIVLNMPGIDIEKLALYATVACTIGLATATLFSQKLFDRRRLVYT